MAADLAVSFEPVPGETHVAEEISYVVSVSNIGDTDADEVRIEIPNPGLENVGWARKGPSSFPSEVDHRSLDGRDGFAVERGASDVAAVDLNGDGFDDLIMGLPFSTRVVFGSDSLGDDGEATLDGLDGTNGFILSGIHGEVRPAGDVNGDKIDDLVVGRYVVFGGSDVGRLGIISESDLVQGAGFVATDGLTTQSISAAGDFNGDGIDDLVIGDAGFLIDSYVGAAWLVYGKSDIGSGGSLNPRVLDGSNGFLLYPAINVGLGFGIRVSDAGDVNNDGFDDVLVQRGHSRGQSEEVESSFLLFGGEDVGTSGVLPFRLPGPSGLAPNIIKLETSKESVSAVGDVNADGFDDISFGPFV